MNHKLCYIEGHFAYFTTQDLNKQWGDDWNDAPYEHNAGRPYSYRKHNEEKGETPWEIIHVAFSAPLETPADKAHGSSRYSVEQINAGAVAWLASDEWAKEKIAIMAGVTLPEFIDKVRKSGGDVYLTESLWQRLKDEQH